MHTPINWNVIIGLLTLLVITAFIVTASHAQEYTQKYGIWGQKAPELTSLKWIDADGKNTAPVYLSDFKRDKVFEMAENMMSRRGITLSQGDKDALAYLHDNTSQYRNFK